MEDNLTLVRRCLTLISHIAARGARSTDEEHVHDTLYELAGAMAELGSLKVGAYEATNHTGNLKRVHDELDFIDSTSEPLTAELILKYFTRSTWN